MATMVAARLMWSMSMRLCGGCIALGGVGKAGVVMQPPCNLGTMVPNIGREGGVPTMETSGGLLAMCNLQVTLSAARGLEMSPIGHAQMDARD